jgi:hypothetical protein
MAFRTATASLRASERFSHDNGPNSHPPSDFRLKNRPDAISGSPLEVGSMDDEGMTDRHLLTGLLAVGADLHDGDALSAR